MPRGSGRSGIRDDAPKLSCKTRRGLPASEPVGRVLKRPGRGVSSSEKARGTFPLGGARASKRRTDPQARRCPVGEGARVFRARDRSVPRAKSQVIGIARGYQPRAAARLAGPPRRGAHDAGGDLQLVHGGLRYRRSEGCQGVARRVGKLNMLCAKCGAEGIPGKKFCAECGGPLSNHCSKCGSDSAPGAKFCADCGAALGAPVSLVAETPPVRASEVAGERRHLTILFCDLVGSVTLAAQVDPEEWRATVAGYQRAAAEAITRFGGEVVRYVGDGIMAFFGYPAAHDNDAERAARAGLAILDAIAQLNQQAAPAKLAVRIGVDSGTVVVGTGTGGGQAVDAFGDAANIAARVETAAEPGTVMISNATERLVAGLFVVEDRGAQELKGIERPVQLYRVIRPSGMRGRFEALSAAGGLTPFV